MPEATHSQIAIIGAGFGGLGMAYSLRKAGIDDFVIFEKAADLGGTWRANTYPGSGCDVPSHFYSYSFEPHYPWRWRYAKQTEILAYQHHCADKYDLNRHMQFNSEVSAASYDADTKQWRIELVDGRRHSAQFLVSAVGQLNRPAYIKVLGREQFHGHQFHSAEWDHDYDLNGKRVAVIGTGASAVQFLPEVAQQAAKLTLFQRTPGWTIPKVERQFSRFERWLLDNLKFLHNLDRLRVFLLTETLGFAYRGHGWAEGIVRLMAKFQLRRQVKDPETRAKLTPDFPVGCKRILLGNDWYPTLCRDNVELLNVGISGFTANGITTVDGQEHAVDAIIHGTGFTATEFLAPMQVTGLNGESLQERWRDGGQAYLGMTVAGFPNFFVLYGPNTNVGSGSIIYMLERQQRYLTQLIEQSRQQGWQQIAVRREVEQAFAEEMQERSESTTFAGDCQSWYKTADGRNTNTWVGSQLEFNRRTRRPDFSQFETL